MFGSMPWCWFPWHKLLPRLAQKNCFKVYSLNLIEQVKAIVAWTTEAIVLMNEMWRKLHTNMLPICATIRANMWQDCSLTAVQRKTAFLEQSWWPEFDMFGSMPWCSFPWHKLVPRLAQKNCHTVYSLNLIHEFTSLLPFCPKVDCCRFA